MKNYNDYHHPDDLLGVPMASNDPRERKGLTIEDVMNILGEPTGYRWVEEDQEVRFSAGVLEIKKKNGAVTTVATLDALEDNELQRLFD